MSAQKAAGNTKRAARSTAARKSDASKATASQKKHTSPASAQGKAAANPAAPLLGPRLKRELVGVLIAVLAVALFIAVVAPGTAILSRVVSDVFRSIIGLGAYILPFLMFIWAASFFVEKGVAASAVRLGIGLALIFMSILAIFSVATPGVASNPDLVFGQATIMVRGGYVGGGIAWVLLKLVGEAISFVILIGLILVGAVLIGFSITGVVARVKDRVARRRASGVGDELELGAYDLDGGAGKGTDGRRARRKLMTATAQLGDTVEPTRVLNADFSQGDQGRIPLDELDDLDVLGDLGSTRRMRAAGGDADADLDPAEGDSDGDAGAGTGDDRQAARTTSARRGSAHKGRSTAGTAGTIDAGAATAATVFELPDMKLLKVSRAKANSRAGESELRRTAIELQETIDQFGVDASVEGWVAGPTVTLFKLSLGEGVRLNKINSLADDIALALAAPAVRIFSPIPGTTLVGIEVPNANRSMVLLGDVLPDAPAGPLQLAVGKDVEGDSIVANLEKMPHLLIGGTTGSGKSVAINAMIMSLLMRTTPAQVRMILIDPKMVELSLYNDIPHLYVPVVTDAQKAAAALAWGVLEMERRLKMFQQAGVKNIAQYNDYVRKEQERFAKEAARAAAAEAKAAAAAKADDADRDGGDADGHAGAAHAPQATTVVLGDGAGRGDAARELVYGEDGLEEMPLILIVIDELADLMMVAGKEVEISISRLAQLARAAGLHLIIATQRPSTNVITGLIKANIVNRIAFNVASGIDSRVILDGPGAEDLIGTGDLLFSRPEYGKPQRIQGCYVSEPEIEAVVNFVKSQAAPEYHEDILATAVGGISTTMMGDGSGGGDDDPLVWEAAEIIVSSQFGSTSTLQRRLKVGYARAGRIMDMLEQKGIVGPPNGSKPREVLFDDVLDLESLKALEQADGADW
ncbi:MAG: DNA translocase FtsK [Coriobacteriales bacterium]|nr:DNA translocase FtsK [Coriobacteriales bacterium]